MCIQSTIFSKVYRIKFKSEYLETENNQQHEVWGLKFLFVINIILGAVTLHSAIFSRPFPNQMRCPVFLMKMLPAAVSAQQHLDYWPQSRLPPRGPHSSGVPGSTRLSLCAHVARGKKKTRFQEYQLTRKGLEVGAGCVSLLLKALSCKKAPFQIVAGIVCFLVLIFPVLKMICSWSNYFFSVSLSVLKQNE